MARPHPDLIAALRHTARRLDDGATRYRWTHMGACNCGHLAQTVTRLSAAEIHARALEKAGDWHQQVRDYCPTSGYPMDHVVGALLELGLTRDDLGHLERLSDARILRRLPDDVRRTIDPRSRDHAARYLRAWADQLEARWLDDQTLPDALPTAVPSSTPVGVRASAPRA
ncbi:MAG: hypothetical protein AAF772_14415 [Acidobacteriota bacterium]